MHVVLKCVRQILQLPLQIGQLNAWQTRLLYTHVTTLSLMLYTCLQQSLSACAHTNGQNWCSTQCLQSPPQWPPGCYRSPLRVLLNQSDLLPV